jgi:hypothetical protein
VIPLSSERNIEFMASLSNWARNVSHAYGVCIEHYDEYTKVPLNEMENWVKSKSK